MTAGYLIYLRCHCTTHVAFPPPHHATPPLHHLWIAYPRTYISLRSLRSPPFTVMNDALPRLHTAGYHSSSRFSFTPHALPPTHAPCTPRSSVPHYVTTTHHVLRCLTAHTTPTPRSLVDLILVVVYVPVPHHASHLTFGVLDCGRTYTTFVLPHAHLHLFTFYPLPTGYTPPSAFGYRSPGFSRLDVARYAAWVTAALVPFVF